MSDEPTTDALPKPTFKTLSEFLQGAPIGHQARIENAFSVKLNYKSLRIEQYCRKCNQSRPFWFTGDLDLRNHVLSHPIMMSFECGSCSKATVYVSVFAEKSTGILSTPRLTKLGHFPSPVEPTPPGVEKVFGEDRELYHNGMRCEKQGLGIAAFAYYRRLVENSKNNLFDRLIKVAEARALTELVGQLREGRKEDQFSKAVDQVKEALPDSLLIDGHHNPLKLLHSALSSHIHEGTDEECLEIASHVRRVLVAFADRLKQALAEDRELTKSLQALGGAKVQAQPSEPSERE